MREPAPIRLAGASVRRLEDPRLLRGQGRFVDDLVLPRMLHAAFVRSAHACARLVGIDAEAARRAPGVAAVVAAGDLAGSVRPLAPRLTGDGFTPTVWPLLAESEVRFAGEPVAVVLASDPYAAADARERVVARYEPRAAVASIEGPPAGAEVLFTRAGARGDVEGGFARAAVVVRETFRHARVAPSPLEPRGALADWDGDTLTLHASTQVPTILQRAVAAALGLAEARVRVIAPDVGGGFGLKMQVLPEDVLVAALARHVGRPVKWIESRTEQLAAASQAREQRAEVEAAADRDGRILALRARVVSDAGAYHAHPVTQALEPLGTTAILPGPYVTPAYAWEATAVRTNKPPLGAYRGVGMTMGAFAMERILDLVAERLELDPAEVRSRNLIPRDAYPFVSASGMTYDSGDYPEALARALALAGYARLREEQAAARAAGRLVGIGLACYTEYTGMGAEVFRRRGMADVPGAEGARVAMDADGSVRCALSFPSQGQGHATAVAQIVAERLGVAMEGVRLAAVDTRVGPAGSGTFGSRGAVALGGAVTAAADAVRAKLARLAAHLLEAGPADIVLGDGHARVRGSGNHGVPVAELARLAHSPPDGGVPGGGEPGLEATVHFDPPGPTFAGAVHVAVVEVDGETGAVAVRAYTVVEDCGRVINPLLVEGQIHGALAQGLGEALLERLVHDDDTGQLLTGSLMDYALPRAADAPAPLIAHLETAAPDVPGGIKGMGEGGTIGAPAALANAVADALRGRGVTVASLPILPPELIRVAR